MQTATETTTGASAVPHRGLVYLGCALFALALNLLLGKEMAWDTLSYHFYAGFSAIHDRSGQDYFAGGFQSYLNPLAYVPFYALAISGLPALWVASLLAVIHSGILCLSFELGVLVSPSAAPRARLLAGLSAMAMAAVNPLLLQQIGTSFADISTAEIALLGWLWLCLALRRPNTAQVLLAGLALGGATALKLTNAVHAVAALAIFAFMPLGLSQRLRAALVFCLAAGAAFLVVAAPWGLRMARQFGNPLFPLFNNWFHSPYFTTAPLRHFRFVPSNFVEGLLRPFALIDPAPMRNVELMAPDLRYAALSLLLAAWAIVAFRRRRARQPTQAPTTPSPAASRVTRALTAGVVIDWTLWLYGSGNGRYFLPGACLAAVALVGLSFTVFGLESKARRGLLAFVLGMQILQLALGTDFRWASVPWGGPWFDVRVPQALRTTPALYLTIGGQSNAFVAPFLAAGSGLINFSGAYALGADGANGRRIEALIRRYDPQVRMLINGAKLYAPGPERQANITRVNRYLERFALRIDPADCAAIIVEGLPPDLEFSVASSPDAPVVAQPPANQRILSSCAVAADLSDHSAEKAEQRRADQALDRMEDACPELFRPRRPVTEHVGNTWSRIYLDTDLNAWVGHGQLRAKQELVSSETLQLGSEAQWLDGSLRLDCGRRHEVYFAQPALRHPRPTAPPNIRPRD